MSWRNGFWMDCEDGEDFNITFYSNQYADYFGHQFAPGFWPLAARPEHGWFTSTSLLWPPEVLADEHLFGTSINGSCYVHPKYILMGDINVDDLFGFLNYSEMESLHIFRHEDGNIYATYYVSPKEELELVLVDDAFVEYLRCYKMACGADRTLTADELSMAIECYLNSCVEEVTLGLKNKTRIPKLSRIRFPWQSRKKDNR